MCDPITIGIISVGSTLMQANAQKQSALANADAAKENARLAREQANAVEDQKARDLTRLHQQETQVKGTQRVTMAGNGLDSQGGSGLGLLQSTALEAKEDEDALLFNSALKKWGYTSQAIESENQARQFKAQGDNAMTAGIISAIGTAAGTAYDMKGSGGIGKTAPSGLASRPASVNATGGLVDTKWNVWNKAKTYNTVPVWGR